jgi:hypothetical protein
MRTSHKIKREFCFCGKGATRGECCKELGREECLEEVRRQSFYFLIRRKSLFPEDKCTGVHIRPILLYIAALKMFVREFSHLLN